VAVNKIYKKSAKPHFLLLHSPVMENRPKYINKCTYTLYTAQLSSQQAPLDGTDKD